jgi:hypothetical protein
MRQQLIEALLYPRKMLEELIEVGNYAQKNMFEATGERCHHCEGTGDCSWDHCLEDFQKLNEAPDAVLTASLREGIRLVESMHRHLRHDETTCTCETCNWIRNAEHLTEEAEHKLPHVDPPGIVHPD